jgi:hypothetical protein
MYTKNFTRIRNQRIIDRRKKLHFIRGIKDTPCLDCKKSYPSYVMEFDHFEGNKVKDVSTMVSQGLGWSTIKSEIEKCEIVCANCHRIRTFNRRINQISSNS